MKKLSIVLATAGLLLLLWSFLPSPSTGQVSAPVTTSTAQTANAATGMALFSAKGCAHCHLNRRAVRSPSECCPDVGPDLTNYNQQPEYLRQWLADPAALKPDTQMPDLNLSDQEIADLIAFLNQPQ